MFTQLMNLKISRIGLATAVIASAALQLGAQPSFSVDEKPIDRSNTHRFTSYADVLEPARQAVVSVATASIVETMQGRGGPGSPMEEFLRRFYGIPGPSPDEAPGSGEGMERRIPNGLGSGVIISADGYILTNNHVVTDDRGEPVDEIMVTIGESDDIPAVIIGRDPRTDVALLKVERGDLPFLQLTDSDNLKVGDIVFAIGNPLGVGQTSTMGIVSATGRTNLGLLGTGGYENFIQTDAAINRGNSGGALLDAEGRLVGINTAIYSRTGGNIGIGFAVPINLARNVIEELIEHGEVRRGYLGVSITDLDAELAEAFGLDRVRGALIQSVQEGTPADKAGLRRGDVIVEVDGREVPNVSALRLAIASFQPGAKVDLAYIREGDEKDVTIELTSLDEPMVATIPSQEVLEGVTVEPLNPLLREEWNITDEDDGLLVTSVDVRSPYSTSLSRGMVILEVNDEPVETVADFMQAIRRGRVNKLWVSSDGNRGFIALRVEKE